MKDRRITTYAMLLFLLVSVKGLHAQANKDSSAFTFADKWEYVGVAVEEPGYTIWGTSPILANDGKVHLFVARWPCELKVNPGWRSHSEIAHYVGDNPEGPFVFSDIALKGTGRDTWDKYGAHNPSIHKVGDQFVLLYIANSNPEKPAHPSNQKIGMALSPSLYGPWEKTGEEGLILAPPSKESYWNYQASNGVNNPTLLQHPKGGFFLYFKSEKAQMGLAIAEDIEGPYIQLPFPVTSNDKGIEDGYVFVYKGKIALLTTDNHGIIEEGGGILWISDDGIHFEKNEKGFHRIDAYTSYDSSLAKVHYGNPDKKYSKFERPQLLLEKGLPSYLYLPSGTNIYGGSCTVSYLLKYKK